LHKAGGFVDGCTVNDLAPAFSPLPLGGTEQEKLSKTRN